MDSQASMALSVEHATAVLKIIGSSQGSLALLFDKNLGVNAN